LGHVKWWVKKRDVAVAGWSDLPRREKLEHRKKRKGTKKTGREDCNFTKTKKGGTGGRKTVLGPQGT